MAQVEVLLRDNVESLGRCGDVVRVSAGYARNYLLPRRIAVTATEENKRVMERRRAVLEAEEAARTADLQRRVELLTGTTVTASEKADENGHLYGSVSAARVAELLVAAGRPCEEREVRLERPIKETGSHEVVVHLHAEHQATITVVVESAE